MAISGGVWVAAGATMLDVPEREFIDFLIEHGVLYRDKATRGLAGMAAKERAGWVVMKRTEVNRPDGTTMAVSRVFITQRGLAKLAELIERKAPHLCKTRAATADQPIQLALLPTALADGLAAGRPT